jgi:hypothetical protein
MIEMMMYIIMPLVIIGIILKLYSDTVNDNTEVIDDEEDDDDDFL